MECNKDNQVPCNRVYNSIINLHFLIMDLIDAISSRLTIKGKLFKQEKMAELYIVNISKNKMECRKAGKKSPFKYVPSHNSCIPYGRSNKLAIGNGLKRVIY